MKPVTRTEEYLEVKLNELIAEQKRTNELLLQLVPAAPKARKKGEVKNDAE
jgi:hypothetical protein